MKASELISTWKLTSALLLAVASAATPALADAVGLLGLCQVKDMGRYAEALKALEKGLGDRGCAVRREGEIAAMDGSLDVAKPDRFLLLECTGSLLKGGATRALFEPLQAVTNHLMLAEGELDLFGRGFSASGVGREYIIKVSHYTNRDPNQRDRDLAAIQEEVARRPNRYRTEAIITPSRARGMTTPDEVVVLYYDSPKDGDQFRQHNGDILEKIGAFNKSHLVGFTYFTASSTR